MERASLPNFDFFIDAIIRSESPGKIGCPSEGCIRYLCFDRCGRSPFLIRHSIAHDRRSGKSIVRPCAPLHEDIFFETYLMWI